MLWTRQLHHHTLQSIGCFASKLLRCHPNSLLSSPSSSAVSISKIFCCYSIASAVFNISNNSFRLTPVCRLLCTATSRNTLGVVEAFLSPQGTVPRTSHCERYHHHVHQTHPLCLTSSNTIRSASTTTIFGSMKDNMDDDKASAIHGQTFVSIEDAIAIHPSRSSTTNVVFVDGSWFLPTLGRNGKEEFLAGPRIEGARFLDIDDIASTSSNMNLPHMMPTYSLFSSWMDAMDITTDDHIVVYGSKQCPFVFKSLLEHPNIP